MSAGAGCARMRGTSRKFDARLHEFYALRTAARARQSLFVSPVPEILIVAEASTARGCRTVRVGIAGSVAWNAPAANRAAALGGMGLRSIGSRRPVAGVGLCIRRVHAHGHG